MRAKSLIFLLLALSVAVSSTMALAAAADPAKQANPSSASDEATEDGPSGEQATEEKPLRFTNDNLPKLGPRDGVRKNDEDAAPGDGAEPAEGEAESDFDDAVAGLEEEARRRGIEETRKEIVMLETRLEHLQGRLLSVQNPYLKRVTPATEAEETAVGGLRNEERLAWVKDQIAATEQALREAQEELSKLLRS